MASALSAGVMAGIGAATSAKLNGLGETGSAIGKFYGGAIKLGTAAAGKAVEYGTHAAYSLGTGGTLQDAYDNMGGITLNLVNLGSILDMVGSGIARNNTTGQSVLGSIAQKLGGTGLLEINIGSSGVTGQIGTGGIDIGGAVYDMAKRGIDRAALERYAAEDAEKGEIAMKNYVFGDWTAENTSARLASGLDELRLVKEIKIEPDKYATALTTSSGKGRLIQMVDSGNVYNNAIQLQHESYRDGIRGSEQVAETVQAVIAHTVMADKMRSARAGYENTANLAQDLAAWDKAMKSGDMSGFALYAASNYDASADYWTLTADGGLEYDGEGYLKDRNGRYINKDGSRSDRVTANTIGAGGIEGGLLEILGVDPGDKAAVARAQTLMTDAGIQHTDGTNPEDWQWRKTGAVNGETVDLTKVNMGKTIEFSGILAGGYGNTVNTAVFMNGFDKSTDAFVFGNTAAKRDEMGGTPDYVLNRYLNFASAKGNFYNGLHQLFSPEQLKDLYISGSFGADDYYTDGQHKGIDIAKLNKEAEVSLYSLFSGKVTHNGSSESAGNNVIISYGFNFEGMFYDTGIEAQFMHLANESSLKVNSYVNGATMVGVMGNTGNSLGPHLHYQLMSQYVPQGPEANVFGMYNSRRDTFLNYVGAPNTSSYVVSNYVSGEKDPDKIFVTTSNNNFWSTQYSKFHYNTNNVLERLGIGIK